MSAFDAYSRYYDAFYHDKDYEAEVRFVHQILCKHSGKIQSLLDLGCGTGIHASHFASLGCQVHGVDMSPSMVERARARLHSMPLTAASSPPVFSVGDIRSFHTNDRFDAATALFHVMSYQATYEDLRAVYRTVKTHLSPGGVFLFDFWYGPAVLHDLPIPRLNRWEDGTIQIIRLAEPQLRTERNSVDVHYTIWEKDDRRDKMEEIQETHCMRYWFLPELIYFLTEAGFDICETGEWMTAQAPSLASWSVYLVATAQM